MGKRGPAGQIVAAEIKAYQVDKLAEFGGD
jgi:hypothetical protein